MYYVNYTRWINVENFRCLQSAHVESPTLIYGYGAGLNRHMRWEYSKGPSPGPR